MAKVFPRVPVLDFYPGCGHSLPPDGCHMAMGPFHDVMLFDVGHFHSTFNFFCNIAVHHMLVDSYWY